MEKLENNRSSNSLFASHMFRYVGIGLISGSIVHIGTLGGHYLRYVFLIIIGITLFIWGILLDHKNEKINKLFKFILVSVIVSIGTGMVSGATQHYLDGPIVASFLLPIGLFIGYLAFIYRDHRSEISIKKIIVACILAFIFWGTLFSLTKIIPENDGHHEKIKTITVIE